MVQEGDDFSLVYKPGEIYIFPKIFGTQARFLKGESKASEDRQGDEARQRLLVDARVDFKKMKNSRDRLKGENAEYQVLLKIFNLLQADCEEGSQPGFILHNHKVGGKEADIIVVHMTLGICIVEVKALEKFKVDIIKKAEQQLRDLKEKVTGEMEGLVEASAVRMYLALPCLPPGRQDLVSQVQSKLRELGSDVELMLGDCGELWSARLVAGRDRRPVLQKEKFRQIVRK